MRLSHRNVHNITLFPENNKYIYLQYNPLNENVAVPTNNKISNKNNFDPPSFQQFTKY